MENNNLNPKDLFLYRRKEKGKNITIMRKLCEICHKEYMQDLSKEDFHDCSEAMDGYDTSDEKFESQGDR